MTDKREITDDEFGELVDQIRDWILWKLPIEPTEDEVTGIDDSVVLMLRDLFILNNPTE